MDKTEVYLAPRRAAIINWEEILMTADLFPYDFKTGVGASCSVRGSSNCRIIDVIGSSRSCTGFSSVEVVLNSSPKCAYD